MTVLLAILAALGWALAALYLAAYLSAHRGWQRALDGWRDANAATTDAVGKWNRSIAALSGHIDTAHDGWRRAIEGWKRTEGERDRARDTAAELEAFVARMEPSTTETPR